MERNASTILSLYTTLASIVPNCEEHLSTHDWLFWVYLCSYVALVLFAGVVSGLTLAILSLDVTSLKVMEKGGSIDDKKYAQRILPLVERHHWVLVALVLANSLAVEAMPLVLDKIANIYVSMTVSVSAVLFIGEVLPQAVCSRYGLAIGYRMTWMVWGLICMFFVIVWPVAKLLDKILGKQHGTFYRRSELLALVDLHGPSSKSPYGKPQLTLDEVRIITSAVEMTSKRAHHLLRPLELVYMIPIDAVFDERTLKEVLEAGHSRIPIFERHDGSVDVVGVVLAKKLILVDPKAKIPVRKAMQENMNHAFTKPYFVPVDEKVHDMLDVFQLGTTHMAFVTKKNEKTDKSEICGIVTLEDIIESLLREQIWDETDKLRKPGSKRLDVIQKAAADMAKKKSLKDGASEAAGEKRTTEPGSRKQEKAVLEKSAIDSVIRPMPTPEILTVKDETPMVKGGTMVKLELQTHTPVGAEQPVQMSKAETPAQRQGKQAGGTTDQKLTGAASAATMLSDHLKKVVIAKKAPAKRSDVPSDATRKSIVKRLSKKSAKPATGKTPHAKKPASPTRPAGP